MLTQVFYSFTDAIARIMFIPIVVTLAVIMTGNMDQMIETYRVLSGLEDALRPLAEALNR